MKAMTEMGMIRQKIKEKYNLSKNNIQNKSDAYFIFIEDRKYTDKTLKKGKVIKSDDEYYYIVSTEMYKVPKYLTFIDRTRATVVYNRMTIDEIRFVI